MRITKKLSIVVAVVLAAATGAGSAAALSPAADPVFQKGEGGYGCFRIPAIVTAPNDDVLAFAEARNSTDCADLGQIELVMKRSTDNGRTWGELRVINAGSNDDWANPVPMVDKASGRLILLSVHNPVSDTRPRTPHVQYSDDNGQQWTDPRSLVPDLGDFQWGHFAVGPGGGIQLSQGEHAGRLVAGINYSDPSGGNGAGLIYSDDGGSTWVLGATDLITDGSLVPQELNLFERSDGGIYAAARENGNDDPSRPTRAYAISTDGGAGFATPFTAEPDLPSTKKVQGSVLRLPDGRALFCAPTHGRLRKELTVRTSTDDGATWQSIADGYRVTDDRAGYSNMTVLPNGHIGLIHEGGDYPDGNANDELRFVAIDPADLP